MSPIVRLSMSLESDLREEFDRYCTEGRFATRSEAFRQLLRERLTQKGWEDDSQEAMATLTLVYDHHRSALTQKLLALQHKHAEQVVSTVHVHLDHDNCLEVIILRGKPSNLQLMAAELRGLKGIQSGQLVLAKCEAKPHHHPHKH